ncbi:MAG: B12-binding domain-containing radical SAM protein [Methyloceanibacter sp.]|uniref:B12-binding domain-containing radical SAM protein n=1 Tax=Methyloceanibacter sp. TaxID=1965321 RepID=UPI003D6C995D
MLNKARATQRRFQLYLIKPSHYDDEGYVVQWIKSTMPSNSLAAVFSLANGAAERQLLGPDLPIDVHAMDETNTRVRPKEIIRLIKDNGGLGLVGIVGAQSNEFPRAVDIARPLREAGLQVVIGGFHVSGCLSMLKEFPPDIKAAQELGICIYAGEAEDGLDEVILDAAKGALKPLYNHMPQLPDIGDVASPPFLPRDFIERTIGNVTSFDAGRGCPFQCSFCTIINVQGRKSRYRSADSVEQIIRMNWEQGIKRFFITDDNFARNKDWEAIFDRIIKLREEDGMDVRFCIQVDTLCHKIDNFIDKSKRAGVTRVFIGLENINPANLIAAKKRQNKITEYRKMLLEWKRVGIMTFAGYILGFANDTPESIRHDLEIIQKELPLDMLEFFILTPLPGSEDHKILYEKGVWMDPDMNKYDVEHVVAAHPKMTKEEWTRAYETAWGIYYTDEHLETILRRAYATGINIRSLMPVLFWFSSSEPVEGVHPLQWGIFRIKHRTDRRPGLPVEWMVPFYARYAADVAGKVVRVLKRWRHLKRIVKAVEADPNAKFYKDNSLTAVVDEDAEHMELYTQNEAARVAVERELRVAGVKPKGAGQPAVMAKANGNGANGRAANGRGNGHAAEHAEPEPLHPESPSPLV